ncbi:MAG: preprotein translocase subunit SecA [Acholeplasmataceae bacterium]|mgnify:FL=1|jgi:preprotein translocase subunit SecA|nr:preprotein translocase subunit SecA [Acholeplasmataceae bacterium]
MFKKLFDPSRKVLKESAKVAQKVVEQHEVYKSLKDEDFKVLTNEFRKRYSDGETLDDLLVEAFALVREASIRVTGLEPYFVQIQGAYVIHHGNIAEMKTGEGKTLTAVMPAYLNALSGEAVHIVTVNEYLARRESDGEIGDLFRFLGLTVGLNIRELTPSQKRDAYNCDILYSTNSELGFDYLRDHMVVHRNDMVQHRGLRFAIIDEVDSILIDEARTPLIISGGARDTKNLYQSADRFAKSVREDEYEIDIEAKTIELLPKGIERAEQIFRIENLYDLKNVSLLHHINNALRANKLMFRDKEYVVQDGEVLIVDQFTGRILKGRQFSEGLHQALEAKENVEIKKETITVATITYQNFFRMYAKLSGMTGTAKTEEEEFREIYNMNVVEIPTNAPVIREDAVDMLFATADAKYRALIKEVKERHAKGQPILIGTIAVETSELLSRLLREERIKHEVLNAKNHAREAEIVLNAGQKGAVTIATNMAGRGTDIKLGEGVVELGGLAVIGSERHESRRIDNQLRGRSGRQGDPGYSRFYLSADDELLMRFGGERFRNQMAMIARLQGDPDEPLTSKMFARFVHNAQKRIEGMNYDTRKSVLKYDDVMRQQREIIYEERRFILITDSIEDHAIEMIKRAVTQSIPMFITGDRHQPINHEAVVKHYDGNLFRQGTITLEEVSQFSDIAELSDYLLEKAKLEVTRKKETVPPQLFNEFLKVVLLRVIDTYWMRHIDSMSELRQAVGLQAYSQTNPLIVYQQEGRAMFEEMVRGMTEDTARYVLRATIEYNVQREQVVKNTSTNQGEEVTRNRPRTRKVRGKRKPWH